MNPLLNRLSHNMFPVPLRDGWVVLRALTGRDELLVQEVNLLNTLLLLDQLLCDHPHARVQSGQASLLSVCDRDTVLLTLYARTLSEQFNQPCDTIAAGLCDLSHLPSLASRIRSRL